MGSYLSKSLTDLRGKDAGADDGRTPLKFALRNDRGLAIIEEAISDNRRTALHWSIH